MEACQGTSELTSKSYTQGVWCGGAGSARMLTPERGSRTGFADLQQGGHGHGHRKRPQAHTHLLHPGS